MKHSRGPLRVLVVDDSMLVRNLVRAILESEPDITVAGEAVNGAEAIAKIAALRPDIVTMDIEMPVMGGLEAIEKIMGAHPLPILVVTALTGVRTAFAAVSKGALDVIEKPDISPENAHNLIKKIRLLSTVDVPAHLLAMKRHSAVAAAGGEATAKRSAQGGIVAIAASTGGPQAIHAILSRLPAAFPLPVVITQHIAEGFTQGMVEWLSNGTSLNVSVARNGDRLVPGRVYVNPAEHSMRVTPQGVVILGDNGPHQIYYPCCDTLLASVAAAYREQAIGLILSGMGDDGAMGMQAIGKNGGVTIAQDAESSMIFGMNRTAINQGCIGTVLPLTDIPGELLRLAGTR